MDIARIVTELKQHRERLSRAIVALESPNRPSHRGQLAPEGREVAEGSPPSGGHAYLR